MNPINAHVELEIKPVMMEMEEVSPEIVLEVDDYIGGSGGSPPNYYEGEYDVIPKATEQKLLTKHKTMRDDVTVAEIPVHEFSNDSGTTIVIGGIL